MVVVVVVLVLVPMLVAGVVVRVAVGDRAVGEPDPPVGEMGMVVMVRIDRQRLRGARAEQCEVLGASADALRRAAATDMAVEADYGVGLP